MPERQRKVVVLPAPLGPTRPITSPGLHFEGELVHRDELAVELGQSVDLDHKGWGQGQGLKRNPKPETHGGVRQTFIAAQTSRVLAVSKACGWLATVALPG